ncbi:bifunctional transcriptional activator/DNA repair enzyme AdaA [Niallia nealsonii]|uniref:AraC family transcriptional regulator n=1 Tax=Niallia nealsonii TaxID=115979 RepID=A0A2N0Z5K0_9BACI|nr:bifunctional transcriptional activator/DNA repair enzyme AdaA [Niallia nealsonii]PKG24779.1 AraC family transcriptional regulator [Niallia nealsonii]
MAERMNNSMEKITEEKWQAIINNDETYNDKFCYGVKTTGVFCKPSCKSRPPKKENVEIFTNADQAILANFRPCKRCKPNNEHLPDNEWVTVVTEYIDKHFGGKLTLEKLADIAHGSPYHLHRIFKKIKGVTPVEYIQQVRLKQAKEQLIQTNIGIAEIALSVGMPNLPYFITLFKKKIGYTPAQYRQMKLMEDKDDGTKK